MKKNLLLLFISFQIVDFAFADGSTSSRSNCRWWRKRYVSEAKATEYWIGPRVCSRSCDNTYAYAASGGGRAKAEAKANSSENWHWEWSNAWYASAGESQGIASLVKEEIPENTKSLKENRTKMEGIKIDPNSGTIYISSLTSKLDISTDDPLNDFAAFRLSIVLEDLEDTLIPPIILEENKAFYINGKLYLEGNFFKSVKFTEVPSSFEDGKAFSLDVGQFIFMNKTIEGKEIVLYSSGDVGNLRLGTPEEYITKEAKELYAKLDREPNLFLFPNPIDESSVIKVSGLENFQGKLTIVDLQGNPVLDLGDISLVNKEEEITIPLSTNSLQPKNYYILLSSGNKRNYLRFKKE